MTMIDNPTWTLSDRLKKARLLAGLEQAELAARIGASRTSISNYETGRNEPTVSVFVAWSRVTGAPLEWLAEGVKPKTAPSEDEAVPVVVHPPGLEPGTH
ncbi:helix-turn-helix domain-containing protein [Plantibacter sp. YIM 135249]|uniref:helix-turn-helix domain-containing protein n=1 Tax=Plantibacter sp. YIM 135249 TaxID=3423918 RepID=UPI003D32609B